MIDVGFFLLGPGEDHRRYFREAFSFDALWDSDLRTVAVSVDDLRACEWLRACRQKVRE